ncbi:MAG: hypothetical protein JKY65_31585 [Planctomycetes bacterium]|nr:hypothetical protein [Planctomycetota bacterium]
MKSIRFLALGLALILAPNAALADEAAFFKERLGDTYAAASPVDKLVMLSVGKADKVFKDYKERARVQLEVDAVILDEIKKGKDSAEKLAILGKIRTEAIGIVKELTTARRKEKKSYVSFNEPSGAMQGAIAMSFVADAAGPAPTVAKLACLKLVREATSWTSHNSLVLGYVTDALARDEAYGKADHVGKLDIITKIAVDMQALSDQERKYLDQAVLADWISSELKAGKSAGDLLIAVEGLKKRQKICWFASSWASGLIKELAAVR